MEKPKMYNKSFSEILRDRVVFPVIVAGAFGASLGLVSKHRKPLGLAKISTAYATNCAAVVGSYCSIREFFGVCRAGENDDLVNSALGGLCTGVALGRNQGSPLAIFRFSLICAAVATAADYAILELPVL